MDFAAELTRSNLSPAVVAGLLDRLQRDANELRNKDIKIQALTLELAHHKRIQFGVKSESLVPEQRDLFQETPLRQTSCRLDRIQRKRAKERKRWRDTDRNSRTGR